MSIVAAEFAAGGTDTHIVTVSVNGEPVIAYDVTAGSRSDEDGEATSTKPGDAIVSPGFFCCAMIWRSLRETPAL